jgi:hypothetical protein
VDIVALPQGLHEEPDKLRQEVQKAVKRTEDVSGRKYDATILGYGLCSNGIVGLSCDIPLVVARAHDCITLILGSKERYREYFDSHTGVYWYSTGWIQTDSQPGKDRYERTLAEYEEKYGADNAAYLMEMEQNWMKEYNRAVYVDWSLAGGEDEKRFTKQCADYMNWEYDELAGDKSLIQRLVDGQWDSEDFLVVEPGKKIIEDVTNSGIIDAA